MHKELRNKIKQSDSNARGCVVIGTIADHIVNELNTYFGLLSSASEDQVAVGSLFNLTGEHNSDVTNKLLVSLTNIERDKTYHSLDIYKKTENGNSQIIKPEIKVNVYFLFIANFNDYQESLKAISRLIAFFQHRHSFNITADATSSNKTARISFDLFPLSFEQQNHVWGMLGGKYIPSVMYKAGILDIQDERVEAEAAPVEEIIINEDA